MNVIVGGKAYQIDGVIFGTRPAWDLIKHEGERMTGEEFMRLPPAEQRQLADSVQQHVESLNRT